MFANKSKFKGPEGTTGLKKKAPPRPPPPSNSQLTRSITIHGVSTAQDAKYSKGVQRQQSSACTYNITNRADLIDLSSPTNSPPKSNAGIMSGLDNIAIPDFKYHIGASIFYVKSELKNTGKSPPQVNPFSPPRPSPQSLLSSTSAGSHKESTSHKARAPVPTKIMSNPTIIKSSAQRTDSVGSTQSSINRTQQKFQPQSTIVPAQSKPNVPLEWDEPPKKTYTPTVIRPIPPPKKPGLGSSARAKNDPLPSVQTKNGSSRNSLPFMVAGVAEPLDTRPVYDEPPGGSEDDDDDDEFDSKPMPNIPPPPPPNVFESSMNNVPADISSPPIYDYAVEQGVTPAVWGDGNRPYGIALYDYVSGEPGDLQFLAGDVIYLKYAVDESWLCGACGAEEGIFPSNFLNIVVPLPDNITMEAQSSSAVYDDAQLSSSRPDSYLAEDYSSPENNAHYVQVLHDFEGTELNDLTIHEGDVVNVLGKINEDWLYGELYGMRGQFPASFLSYIPSDLITISLDSLNG